MTGVPEHAPAVQTSLVEQALPSLQTVPLGATGFEHVPVAGLQVPAVWHWSWAVHVIGVPPHVPLVHRSLLVHSLPSLHDVPLGAVGFEQAPVVGLHTPTAWHWSLAVQTTGLEPVHAPAWHVYDLSQRLVPLHVVPLAAGVCVQVPLPAHASTVHGLLSSQEPAAQHSAPAFSIAMSKCTVVAPLAAMLPTKSEPYTVSVVDES